MHHSVHPHLCGAYVVGMDAPPVVGGSSPPTWGIRLDSSTAFLKCGSSPHTWGIHRVRGQERAERRFIPTYVGHTRPRSRYHPHPPVHPHIRGAYFIPLLFIFHHPGSSPHTWGIQTANLQDLYSGLVHPHIRGAYGGLNKSPFVPFRFIPTYVGHTWQSRQRTLMPAVHPHIRGAYQVGAGNALDAHGSSPHTWGIRFQITAQAKRSGSSPHTWGIHSQTERDGKR